MDLLHFGGGKRDRTADLLHAMQALSQLSYTPKNLLIIPASERVVRQRGAILMMRLGVVNHFYGISKNSFQQTPYNV